MGKNTAGLILWQKGQSGNPKGRPRKILSKIKDLGYTNTEISQTLKNIASMTTDELDIVIQSTDATILEKLFAKSLEKSLKKGSLHGIETLLNRAYGTPQQMQPEPIDQPDASKEFSDDPIESSRQYQDLVK